MSVWTPALVALLVWPVASLPVALAVGRSFARGGDGVGVLDDLERLPVTTTR